MKSNFPQKNMCSFITHRRRLRCALLLLGMLCLGAWQATADTQTSWMLPGKYGIFMHYQYRILLGSRNEPPYNSETAAGFNAFVDGFDVNGFANQMAQGKVAWVIFGIDDSSRGWQCSPNATFNSYTGYAPGQRCSNRDLIMELSVALHAKGIKLICYWDGMDGWFAEPQVCNGMSDDCNEGTQPSDTSRMKRLNVLREYCNRFGTGVDGWWFDGLNSTEVNYYNTSTNNYSSMLSIVRAGNPNGIIAYSDFDNEEGDVSTPASVQDYAGGDTYTKLDLTQYVPNIDHGDSRIQWHRKIYCGNVYHGLGTANQYSDGYLETWVQSCNSQGGVCTMDWPFNPQTGLLKDFGIAQLTNIGNFIKPSGGQKSEAESLTVHAQTSGVTYRIVSDPRFSGSVGAFFDSTATNQFLTYAIPNVAIATYDVRVGIKSWNNKGIWQLNVSRLDGTGTNSNVGLPVDEYTSGEVFSEIDLGNWTPGTASDKAFKFTVTGKNAASTGYGLDFDYIKLIPQ